MLVVMRGGGKLMGGITTRERIWRFSRALTPGIAFAAGLALSLNGETRLAEHAGPRRVWPFGGANDDD